MESTNVNIASNFNEDFKDSRNSFGNRIQRFFQAVRYYFMQIWPYIRTLINFVVYQTIKVVKGVIKIGLTQTGLIKD